MLAEYIYSDLKIAVIGCGNWGKNHIRVFHALGALYTICDADPNHAATVAAQFSVSASTLDEILASPHIDACVIVTPARTHFDLAKKCLSAGKHVFIEKPITTDSHQAQILQQAAKAAKRILMTGHLLHYHRAFNTLQQLVQENVLGQIYHIFANRWTFGKLSTETSVLWDVAPHDISMILSLMGEMPYQVMATTSKHLSHHTHDCLSIDLWFGNERRAKVECSWIHPIKKQMLTVVGDRYMAVFDDTLAWKEKLCLYNQMDKLPALGEPIPLASSEPLTIECQHFLDCILQNQTPKTDPVEALNVTRVLEAALESSHLFLPVTLESTSFALN